MAAGDLPGRGGHLHGRPGPGRGAGAGPAQGGDARHQAVQHLHRGPARGVHPRLRVPHVPRQRAVRGRVPARHLHRPAADRQDADRDRQEDGRGCRLSRRHRQGQRPGALRAQLLRAGALDPDYRALAGVEIQEPRGADRVRGSAPDPRVQGQARRSAVLGRCQHAALLLGRQSAGGPGRRAAALRLPAHHLAHGSARQGDRHHHRLRQGRRGERRRQGDVARHAVRQAQRARPRQWHRPGRPGREPLRRHEIARRVRDPGRHHPARRAPGSRSRSTAAPATSRTS